MILFGSVEVANNLLKLNLAQEICRLGWPFVHKHIGRMIKIAKSTCFPGEGFQMCYNIRNRSKSNCMMRNVFVEKVRQS